MQENQGNPRQNRKAVGDFLFLVANKEIMKRIVLILASVALMASCKKEEKTGNLHLTGDIHGLKKGKLYIGKLADSTVKYLDSIEVNGASKFDTHVQIDEPEMLYLFLDRGTSNSIDNSLAFFAEPGEMNIDTQLETFYAKAKVTGSKNHDLYEQFKTIKTRFNGQQLDMTKKRMDAMRKVGTFTPEDQAKEEAIIRRRYLYTVNFAMNNKDKEIAPYVVLSEIPDATVKYLDTVANGLTPKVASSKYGKMLTEYVKERKALEKATPAAEETAPAVN